MKKIIIFFTLITIIFGTVQVNASNDSIQVTIDEKVQSFEQPPIIKNGRTLVPLRKIFEGLGATVAWDSGTHGITAVKDTITIKLIVGSNEANINEEMITLDQPAEIINGRTMVPLRFVSESLGAKVEWDGELRMIKITSKIQKKYHEEYNTQLLEAVKNNNLEEANKFLELGANPNATDGDGYTPLMTATKQHNTEMITILLEKDANPNIKDVEGKTVLFYPILYNETQIIKVLLDANADPNTSDLDGKTPLFFATEQHNIDIAKYLLEAGADPNLADKSNTTPLSNAAYLLETDMVQLLIDANANLDIKDIRGDTALLYVTSKYYSPRIENLVKIMLAAGANPDIQNNDGRTALWYATFNATNNPAIVQLLLDANANPNIQANKGETALMLAKTDKVAEILLQSGANPNLIDNENNTALINAAQQGRYTIVELLLNNGVDLSIANQGGRAIEVAEKEQHSDIVALINSCLSN